MERNESWYDIEGEGQPIVFLHAALGDRRMWRPQWDHFRSTNRVARFDLAGFGDNPIPSTPFSRTAQVRDVLRQHAVSDAVIVGASMGGRVAVELAADSPDLVSALVLLCSALPGHDWSQQVQEFWRVEEQALVDGDLDAAVDANLEFWVDGPDRDQADLSPGDRELVAVMQRRALEHALASDGTAGEQMLIANLAERLADIKAPTIAAYGTDDAGDIETIARRLAAELPNAELVAIEKTAHVPSLERPDRSNELIEQALRSVS